MKKKNKKLTKIILEKKQRKKKNKTIRENTVAINSVLKEKLQS
jgi:hypothetical protein